MRWNPAMRCVSWAPRGRSVVAAGGFNEAGDIVDTVEVFDYEPGIEVICEESIAYMRAVKDALDS